MQNGHGRESGGCVELGLEPKESGSVQLSGEQMSSGGDCLGSP